MKINKKIIFLLVLVISIIISGIYIFLNKDEIQTIPYNLFLTHLEKGIVKEVELSNAEKIKVILDNGNILITDNPRTVNFKEELLLYGVIVNEKNNSVNQIMPMIIIFSILGFTVIYLNKYGSKQAEKEMAGLSKMDLNNNNSKKIKFKDVAGNEEAKESLMEMVDFIKNPESYSKFGARLPRGVLLYGPPGTGKTLLAKAMAGEAGVPFFPVSGSDFVQVYAGLGAGRIRELFKNAKEIGKSVIFIDEIDSLGKKRNSGYSGGSDEGDRTLNALLTEMSGFNDNEGIIVIAATNRIDILDEALLRPGRFDRQIEINLPDCNGRYEILKYHSNNKPIARDINLKKLAEETVYFSGAKLENLMNEAAINAVREKSKEIKLNHIEEAYFTVLVGDEKKDRTAINMKDREITAYHEAGHALVTKLVAKDNKVSKVSIIPSTKGIGGFSLNIPKDRMYQTKNDIISNIMIALGGRAAEDIIYGKELITTGASSDLEKATEMVLSMIGVFGMDEDAGLVNYNILMQRNLEDGILIKRSKEILDKLYSDTIKILENNIDKLTILAQDLIKKEVISEDEINKIVYSI